MVQVSRGSGSWAAVMVMIGVAAAMCSAQPTRVHRNTQTLGTAAATPAGAGATKLPDAPPPAQVQLTPKTNPPAVAQATAPAQCLGVVGWDYLRMHQPELVLGMIQDVQAGKMPRAALNGLASPEVVAKLVGYRWDLERLQDTPHQLLLTPATQTTRSQPSALGGGALTRVEDEPTALARPRGIGWQLIRQKGESAALIGFPDYAPKQLNFGPLWDRQRSLLRMHVTATADGLIMAALPEGRPFKIVRMVAYDGPWDDSDAGGAASTSQQPRIARRHVSASRSAPPWTLNVQAGQDVEIAVEAYFDLFKTGVGAHDAVLQITGNSSATTNASTAPPSSASEPAITSFQPQSTGVALDARVRVGFSEAMDKAATQGAFWVRQTTGSVPLPGTFAWVGNEMQFTPAAALAPLATYQAVLNATARSATGAGLGHPFVWLFTTRPAGAASPALPPLTTSFQPQGSSVAPGAKIRLAFDQAMNTTATQAALWMREEGTATNLPMAGTFAWAGNEMQYTPAAALPAPKTYRVGLSAAAKSATGVGLGNGLSWVFTTRPPDPPPMAGPAPLLLSPRWAIRIPVHGQFLGLNLGVLFTTDHPDTDLVADASALAPGEPHRFEVPVKLTNTNADASGEIQAESLPPGVSMTPVKVDVPKDATVAQTLHFAIDVQTATDNIYYAPHGVPYQMVLRYDANGKTSRLNLNLTLHDCFGLWQYDRLKDWVGDVSICASFLMRSSGEGYLGYYGEDYTFGTYRGPHSLVEVWATINEWPFTLCTAEPFEERGGAFNRRTPCDMTFRTPAEYIRFIHQPLYLHIRTTRK